MLKRGLNMTKKLMLFGVAFLFLFLLIGCDTSTTTTTTASVSTDTSETTTTTTTTSSTTGTTLSTSSLIDFIPEECSTIPIEDGWVPVWCDEFNYTGGVDMTKWSYVIGGGGYGNEELQNYTSRSNNIYVDGEYLKIIALNETYYSEDYTSAKIWTRYDQSWKYGKFEMRAMLPAGRGTWPAFWMMPTTSAYGGWPNSGEIDIMEHVGYDMNEIHGTIHTERFWGSNGRGGSATILVTQEIVPPMLVAEEFHTYGIEWDETSITWFFDGHEFASVGYNAYFSQSALYDTSVDWPFNQNFYLILNLAIGGTWGGAQGVDDTIFPATFTIDYVRVYQQDYIAGDSQIPSAPTNPSIVYTSGTTAYLIWNEAEDDKNIASYFITLNGLPLKITSVPGIRITNLVDDFDNIIAIYAEDYAGNVSSPLEVLIST